MSTSIQYAGGISAWATMFCTTHETIRKSWVWSLSRKSWEMVCAARMHAYMDTLPVMTSFPDENNSPVHVGSWIRIVMAANRLRSYLEFGKRRATRLRSIHPELHSIWDVLTILWQTGTGESSSCVRSSSPHTDASRAV